MPPWRLDASAWASPFNYVIDMCVKMMNPQESETLIDTAAGSCGFPVHAIFHVWKSILQEEGLSASYLFTAERKPARCEDYVRDKVFAIDFDEKTVRVGRTLNLIAGDGQTNVLHLNTLDYEHWDEKTKDENWSDVYSNGWKLLRKLRAEKDSNRNFQFDILMANPPFAGDIKEMQLLSKYELSSTVIFEKINNVNPIPTKNISDVTNRLPTFPEALHASHEVIYRMADGTYRKVKVKHQTNVGRDILFIERNLQFLKPGGRMAVVLPQGRFNNTSDKSLREFIAEHCRILAVVGLHGNVFKPHTGTKTSVLFVQKWNDDSAKGALCPMKEDYPIFFATMSEQSKDNSGRKIYRAVRHGFPAGKVAEIERLQAKWRTIDKEEAELFYVNRKGGASVEQKARLTEITTFRAQSEDEIKEAQIDLDAPMLDSHGHLIVKHDLFNHDGLTGDGIAEAFEEFAKKEKLSFFQNKKTEKSVPTIATMHGASCYRRNSREVFSTGRLDAEHFHPKFQALMNSLRATGNCVRLGDYLLVNQRGKQPDYVDEGLPVINSKHVLRNEIRLDEDNRQAEVEESALLIQTNDVLINGTGVGTIGRAAAYLHENPALPDNHVTILRPSDILDPVYLSVYLNSVAGQLQVEQRLRGSSGQIELYPADIAEFRIWLAPQVVQKSIRQQVEQSFERRQQAIRLLDVAKRTVEIAIEDSEAIALKYLADQLPKE